jgi:hypothetical protein
MRVRAANGRLRLAGLGWLHPGLRVAATASPCFGIARISLTPGAKLTIGANAVTEYRPGLLNLVVYDGAEIELAPNSWLRTEVGPVNLTAFEGARIVVGPEVMLNACSVSAQREVVFERRSTMGPGSRIYDFTHDLDDARKGSTAPVRITPHRIASDVTVLRAYDRGALRDRRPLAGDARCAAAHARVRRARAASRRGRGSHPGALNTAGDWGRAPIAGSPRSVLHRNRRARIGAN